MRVIRREKESIATGWVIANFPDSQSGVVAGLGASFFVKAIYRLRPGEVPIPWADEPVTGCGDVALDGNPAHGISYGSDWVPYKLCGEFMAVGTAYSPSFTGSVAYQVRMQVGSAAKSLDVIGDRVWNTSLLGLHSPGPASPVKAVPLTYSHAWGGPKYPYNPVGRGFRTHAMPNLEVPGAHALKYTAEAWPAGFAPIPPSWPQRSSKLRGPDGQWRRHRWPWLPEKFDYTFFNAAPPDQWIDGFFRGDESLAFENMHPEQAVFTTRLPGMRARCFVTKRQADDDSQPAVFCEVPLSLDTLWVDMDREKLSLVWRGRTPVRSVKLRDIETLLVLLEPLDEPDHPLAHYEAMIADGRGAAAAQPTRGRERPDFVAMKAELEARVEAVKKEIADAEALAEQVKVGPQMARLKAAGHVPPPPEEFEAAVAAAKRNAEEQLAHLRVSLERNPAATPEQIETAKRASSLLTQGVSDLLALPAQVAAKKAEFDAKMAAAFPPKKVIDRTAFDVEAARREGFAKAKLRDADFTGLDLSGVSFAGAFLREANFARAKLCGADLSGANLCGADLSGTDLTGARLDHADLQRAIVAGAVWKQASLTQSKLTGLDLTRADFSGATGTRPDFTEAILAAATFCGANLPQAVFRKAVLTDADFTHTHLQDADFGFAKASGIRMADSDLSRLRAGHGADFSCADLRRIKADGSIWKGSNLAKANFQQASLVRARFPEARLPEVIFDRCDLAHGVFEDAQLSGAVLTNANLLRVAFDRADLTDASFDNANLYEAGFWDAVLLRTRWEGAEATESLLEQIGGGKR
jgi:uncharacterized protein YjbI with pentapeptide repeats